MCPSFASFCIRHVMPIKIEWESVAFFPLVVRSILTLQQWMLLEANSMRRLEILHNYGRYSLECWSELCYIRVNMDMRKLFCEFVKHALP